MNYELRKAYILLSNILKNVFINAVIAHKKYNDIKCYVPASTKFVHYGIGVVIAKEVKLGNNIVIYQDVTIGGNKGAKYPEIKDNVKIYARAKILGGIVVGRNSIIGANATVLRNVLPFSTVVGVYK